MRIVRIATRADGTPIGSVYHYTGCYVLTQSKNIGHPWVDMTEDQAKAKGFRLCRATGGCSG